ncbi:MAG: hypothetical protein AMXMBFR78_33390 [Rubrivivax sp.]|jgi:signal transduction histidine kinase|nr:cache domain-containing protein [Rubrivivax sp.]
MTPMKTLIAAAALAITSMAAHADKVSDAKAMLDKAISMVQAKGKDAATAELNAGGNWHQGGVYVVYGQLDGTILAHSANSKMAGKNTAQAKDAAGKEFVKENLTALKSTGSSEITMRWANPDTNKIDDAIMFSKRVPGTDNYVSAITFVK